MFREKGILPSSTYNMKRGERLVATAFLKQELEEKAKMYGEDVK